MASSDGFCTQEVSIIISAVSAVLFITSELLGSRDNKSNKITSVVQLISAGFLWGYRKFLQCCCCQKAPPEPIPPEEDVASVVSRNVTIRLPKWRDSARPLLQQSSSWRRRQTAGVGVSHTIEPPTPVTPVTAHDEQFTITITRRPSAQHNPNHRPSEIRVKVDE